MWELRQGPGPGPGLQNHEPGTSPSLPQHRSSHSSQHQHLAQQKTFSQAQTRSFSASSMYHSRRASHRSSSAAAAVITSSATAPFPSSDSPTSLPLPSLTHGWSTASSTTGPGLVQPIPPIPPPNSSHFAQQQSHVRRRSRSHSRAELRGRASSGLRRGPRPRASSLQPSPGRSAAAASPSLHHQHKAHRMLSSPNLLMLAPTSQLAAGSSHIESLHGQPHGSMGSMIPSSAGTAGGGTYTKDPGGIVPVGVTSVPPATAAATTYQQVNYPPTLVQHLNRSQGTIHQGDLDQAIAGGDRQQQHYNPFARGSGGPGSAHSAPTEASSTSRGARYSLTPRTSDRGRGGGVISIAAKQGGEAVEAHHHPTSLSRLRSDEEAMHAKTCRRVMEDLNRAQRSERRIAALTHLCECCDHKDEGKHNIELSLGMLYVLAKCLHTSVYDDEVRMICAALEMVLRASPRDVQVAYLKLNASHHNHVTSPPQQQQQQQHTLLANLFRILERCESNALKHSEVSILNITKVVFYLSRCPELRTALCRQPAVLDSLERVGRSIHGSVIANGVNDASTFFHHVNQAAEVRFYRMRTLANLANVEDNKVLLLEHQDGALLESVLRVSHWDSDDSCRQYASSSLMDLASAPSNQVSMASNEKVLGTLVKMALVEKVAVTREFVITALQNLAFCKENRVRLVGFKDGVLLEALKQALSADLDAKARRRAAGALTNLVCDETAEPMGRHRGLLDALAIVATKDDNWDVQTRASLALTKIANCITIHMDCHDALLDALVVASLSKANNSVSAVLRVKARNPENREVMARHPGIIDTLTDLCLSLGAAKANDRDNAIRALMHLLNENRNRKILCTKNVLEALVAGANNTESDLEEARDSAIRALERLATDPTNRDAMARHPGLITAVARAVEREAGWEASGREAPENGYLAKPLLMSLLVAM